MSLTPKEVGSFTTANPEPGSFEEQSDSTFVVLVDNEDYPPALQNNHAVQNAEACSQIRRGDLPSIKQIDGFMKKRRKLNDSDNDDISDLDVSIYSDEKKKDAINKYEPLTSLSLTSNDNDQPQQFSHTTTLRNSDTYEALSIGSTSSTCSSLHIDEDTLWKMICYSPPQQSLHTTLHDFGSSLMQGCDDNLLSMMDDLPMEASNSLLEENDSNTDGDVHHDEQYSSEANSMQQVSLSTSTETGEGGNSHGHDSQEAMLPPMSYNNSEIRPNEPGSSSYTLLTPAYDIPLHSDQAASNAVLELNASEDTAFMRVPRSLFNKLQPNGEPELKKIKAYCTLDSMQKNVNVVLARLNEDSITESELCDNVMKIEGFVEKLKADLQYNAKKDVLVAAENVVPNLPEPEGADTTIYVEGYNIRKAVWADAYSKMDLKKAAVCLFEELYTDEEKASSTLSGRSSTHNGLKIKPSKLDPVRLNVIKHAVASMINRKGTYYYDPNDFAKLKPREIVKPGEIGKPRKIFKPREIEDIEYAVSQRLNQIKQVKKVAK